MRVTRRSPVLRSWQALAACGLGALALHATAGIGADRLFNVWLYTGLELLAVLGCATRALLRKRERAAWGVLATGLLAWTVGDILFDFAYGADPPFPSIADGFYLAFYPALYLGLALLVRSRFARVNASTWLDGATVTLASASIGAAIVFERVADETHGSTAVIVTNLAYPLGDIVLFALVLGVVAISGRRTSRAWLTIGAAFTLSAIADSTFLYEAAAGTYEEGTLLDVLWPASMLLIAVSAWSRGWTGARIDLEGRPLAATPVLAGATAILVLLITRGDTHAGPAVALAGATVAAILVRTTLTFRENHRILERVREQSTTDALTGLGNRRKLMQDLDLTFAHGSAGVFAIFDLDGFKNYNDTFGHPAGDALLARLGARLAEALPAGATSYRLGGDEFCVVAPEPEGAAAVNAANAALTEAGEGFAVTSSHGVVRFPEEAPDKSEALRIADQRLYVCKRGGSRGSPRWPHDVLVQVLSERESSLSPYMNDVNELVAALGRRLGLTRPALEELRFAAQLHDVGKLAVPDSILAKEEPLAEDDWDFLRQVPQIGQRILDAAPPLQPAGLIVRASRERFDGLGYPDGLRGEEIPLGARIIAACDAYVAMTSERPYRAALTATEALGELRRDAGTRYDPAVVDALAVELELPASAAA